MRRFIVIVALALCASLLSVANESLAAANLIKNGDLAAGYEGAPADWYALSSDKKLTKFSWSYTPGEGGVLGIANQTRTYSSWHQAMMLRPGTYHVTAEARVEGAMPREGGANIAINTFDGFHLSSNRLQGTTGWQTLSFFVIEDRWGDATELVCELGLEGYPDTGRASFRNIQVVEVAGRPPPGAVRFDLSAIRKLYKDQVHQPDTRIWIRIVGVVCGAVLLGLLAWGLAQIWRPAIEAGRSAWIVAAVVMLTITAIKFAALFHFTGFYWDIWAKTNRALLASALGPAKIYDPGLPVDAYPPGSVYLLWLSGWIGRLLEPNANGFRVIVETPPLIADLLIGLTIFFAAWREGRGIRALIVMMLFALNPALIFDTVVWGQSDSVVALAMIAAVLLIVAGRHRLGWSAVAIALLAKPQAIAFTPPLALWTLFNAGIAECVWCAGAFLGTFAIGVTPYQLGHSWDWVLNVYQDLGTRFSEASVGAFNFMGLIGGMGTPDTDSVFLGVSYRAFGVALLCAVYLIVSWMIWRARSAGAAMLAVFVALFGFFMFAPRMHERYMYYPVVFLVPIALESGFLTSAFAVVSATFLFNLIYIKHLTDVSSYFPDQPNAALIIAASINLAAFLAITAYGLLRSPREELNGEAVEPSEPAAGEEGVAVGP
ncbi:MAG TPA: glycosyltransferase 87 family protein [Patescibacteria group bacterium]|nr:glycosyltransferase 87 family protein [Patescibacteria group bacterium]